MDSGNQIGCGYCYYELQCKHKRMTKNLAKAGCPCWRHFDEARSKVEYSYSKIQEFINKKDNGTKS